MEERIANSPRQCFLRASRDPEGAGPPAWQLELAVKTAQHLRGSGRGIRLGEREEGAVARTSSRARPRRRRLRLLLPVAVLGVMGFLYYHPLASYLETRSELGARQAQVVARSSGIVKPGDRLVITAGTAVNIPGSTNVIKVDIA